MTSYLMITGATGGLGSALAIECASRGMDLYLTDLRPDGAAFAQALIQEFGIQAHYYPCDLTSPDSRSALVSALQAEQAQFWGLFNVAGTDYEGEFLERQRAQVLTILRLNIEATVDMTQAILQLRDRERRFMLLNVCSLAAITPMPYKAIYAASKRFLLDFSLALREEIKPFGSVTALCPAGMPTTTETVASIFAQGFWGKATTFTAEEVARQAISAALQEKAVVIPGIINQALQRLSAMVPPTIAAQVAGKRWKEVRQRRRFIWKPNRQPLAGDVQELITDQSRCA